jgi:peptidoglycan/LPS O-acetylase OafA/YrhL
MHSHFPAALRAGLLRRHLVGLDGFRAAAAFLVVFYHAGVPYASGGLGVLLFFVLSGFLITWLLLQEQDVAGQVRLGNFYMRRALRIFPAFYAYAALVLVYQLVLHKDILWPQTMAAWFYVNNYYQAIHGDPNTPLSHTWSLAVEEQFYLLWPWGFLALSTNLQRMKKVLLGTILLLWIYRAVLVFVLGASSGYVYEALDARADHLLIGCLTAVLLRTGSWAGFWRRITGSTPWAGLIVGLLATSSVLETLYGRYYRDSVGAMLHPVLGAVLIVQLISLGDSPAGTWIEMPWLRYLGRISYSVYLYQQLFASLPAKYLPQLPVAAHAAIAAVLIVIAASFSYHFVERPFLRLKTRFERP